MDSDNKFEMKVFRIDSQRKDNRKLGVREHYMNRQ